MDGLLLQPTEFGLLAHELLQPATDVDMTHLLETTELHLTSNMLPFAAGPLYTGLDSKPLNARRELQKPMPLLTDLLKHILTSYSLSGRLL
jgi:hypothetical protein